MAKIDTNVLNILRESTGDDFINELIDTFLDDAPSLLAQMREALAAQDAETFRRAAHSMKSNAATFGAMELSALAKELEGFGREQNLNIGDRLSKLEAEYHSAAEELETLKI